MASVVPQETHSAQRYALAGASAAAAALAYLASMSAFRMSN